MDQTRHEKILRWVYQSTKEIGKKPFASLVLFENEKFSFYHWHMPAGVWLSRAFNLATLAWKPPISKRQEMKNYMYLNSNWVVWSIAESASNQHLNTAPAAPLITPQTAINSLPPLLYKKKIKTKTNQSTPGWIKILLRVLYTERGESTKMSRRKG